MKFQSVARFSLLLILSMSLAWRALAQMPDSVGQTISYQRDIPREVKRLLPRGARSCFYGRFQLANNKQFAIHLFNPSPRQDNPDGNFQIYRLRLHLFEQGRNSKMRLINNVAVHYRAMVGAPKKFGAQLLWLDPKRHAMPILKFDCFEPKGFEGLIGDHVLVVFSQGLKSAARVQSLAFGSWSASDYGAQNTTFNEVDGKGLLQLRVSVFPLSYDPAPQYISRWNGQKFFVASAKNAKNAGQNPHGPPFPSTF